MSDSDLDGDDDLEDTFNQAAEFVQQQTISGNGVKLSQDIMLKIYGYYKVATVGSCNDPKPGFFDPRGRAKWQAWKDVSNNSKEEGMKAYIKLVTDNYGWNPNLNPKGSSANASAFGGNAVSSFAKIQDEELDPEYQNTIFAWVRDNDLTTAQKWLTQDNSPNIQDKEGMSPLHWAVDRGFYEFTELLLNAGADPRVQDNDGNTALDYAETCEYENIVTLLQEKLKISS